MRDKVRFEQWLEQQGVTLHSWQKEAAEAFFKDTQGQRRSVADQTFLLSKMLDFSAQHRNKQMTVDYVGITAIAAEVARLLMPVLTGKPADDPASRLETFVETHSDPTTFAARRQACLEIAAKKGCLRR